jgi:hypothetical protein
MEYDLIGDIHGHALELHSLLEKMGYRVRNGFYCHPDRKAIFLGDFIDRGRDQRAVLETVMAMVKNGAANAVMGNHEFNALAFHTPDPGRPGCWLRPRSDKNIHQHMAFLQEYYGADMQKKLEEVLEFFWSLPLWLELQGLRVVHACWDQTQIDFLRGQTGAGNRLTKDMLAVASETGTPEHQAIEVVLKGIEQSLPKGRYILDKGGTPRRSVRIKWWKPGPQSLGTASFAADLLVDADAALPVQTDKLVGYPSGSPPLFIGHYWMKGRPELLAENLACLDYSVAKGGKLVAYRWGGEQRLDAEKFAES